MVKPYLFVLNFISEILFGVIGALHCVTFYFFNVGIENEATSSAVIELAGVVLIEREKR